MDQSIISQNIFDEEIKKICSRYKIDSDRVKSVLYENILNHPNLIKKLSESKPGEDVTRLKEYKNFIKQIKKQIYYDLRKYHKDKHGEINLKNELEQLIAQNASEEEIKAVIMELLSTHISTQERVPYHEPFYNKLFDIIAPPKSIIDIGCGLHPLSYPFEKQKLTLKTYYAIDKDPAVIEILNIFAPYVLPIELIPVCKDISDINWSDYIKITNKFDLAFMLKLIPVLYRHSKDSLNILAEIPADRILITGNIEAMTRKEKIMRRENKIINKFIADANKQIIDNFNVGNEFGYFIS